MVAKSINSSNKQKAVINIADYLPQMAEKQPNALAVAVACERTRFTKTKYKTLTAYELNRRCDRIAHALVRSGITKGCRTVFMVKPSLEFFAITFALLKIGAIPVMVDPGMGIKNLGQCLAEANPEAFIGIPHAHIARILFGWCKKTLKINITVGRKIFWSGFSLSKLESKASNAPYAICKPKKNQIAAIMFTSGSTGVPKGVVATHGVFAAQVNILKHSFGIEPGEIDLSTFPLFALFGPALGMASVVPEMDTSHPASANPVKLIEAINDFSCTNIFASPALIDKLGRYCTKYSIKINTLRRAISAGAPASIPAIDRFQNILANGAEIFTPYGSTESLPVSIIGSAEILNNTRYNTENGKGVCVGKPVPEIEVKIIPINDDVINNWSDNLALSPNKIGEIVVKGPQVTHEYYNREHATKLAKIYDKNGTFYHRMGDVGYMDKNGTLWMCGRKSHRVETIEGTMFTIPCEAIFNTNPKVFRSALVGVEKNGSILPVICIELEKNVKANYKAITHELLEIAKAYKQSKSIKTVLYHKSFPVDVRHNAKIFREKLSVWAQEKLA